MYSLFSNYLTLDPIQGGLVPFRLCIQQSVLKPITLYMDTLSDLPTKTIFVRFGNLRHKLPFAALMALTHVSCHERPFTLVAYVLVHTGV